MATIIRGGQATQLPSLIIRAAGDRGGLSDTRLRMVMAKMPNAGNETGKPGDGGGRRGLRGCHLNVCKK